MEAGFNSHFNLKFQILSHNQMNICHYHIFLFKSERISLKNLSNSVINLKNMFAILLLLAWVLKSSSRVISGNFVWKADSLCKLEFNAAIIIKCK